MKQPVIIFTDGASRGNPGPGGWGVIVFQDGMVKELGDREDVTTNNRMELTAAIEALTDIKNSPGDVVVHTDSRYVIQGITAWVHGWVLKNWMTSQKEAVLNRDLWEKLLSLTKARKGTIEWKLVSGHAGVSGNERTDEIATSFADQKPVELYHGPKDKYPIDLSNISTVEDVHDRKKRSREKAYSYVSCVDGDIAVHKTWHECEARVKGKSGAKYKKAISPEDEQAIIASWK